MSELKSSLRQYIAENFMMGAGAAPLADDSSLMAQHVLDSSGFMELVTYLEERYGISIGDEEMLPENLDSIEGLARFVERKRGG